MSLEQQIAALVTETSGLTQEVRDQLANIQAAVAQAEGDVNTFIQQGAANFPVGPNLMPDTKKFTGLCNGQLNTILPWDQGGLGGAWGASWLGASGTLDVEVVYVGDTTRLTELGLYPLGDLSQMVEPFPHPTLTDYGLDSNVAVFDLTIDNWTKGQPVPDNTIPFAFAHDCLPYTSWFKGQFKTQSCGFISVLSASVLDFVLFRNRSGGHVPVGAAQAGQGWKFYHAELDGFGGCNNSFVSSDLDVITPSDGAHLKFALALPYQGFGYHQGIPVWAGSAGRWDVDDHL